MRQQRCQSFRRGTRGHRQGVPYLGIRGDFAFAVDHHVGHHYQPIDVRVERTQTVAKFLGQHRNHATREIHRGRAVLRLGVERVAVTHIVRNIGDRHHQAPLAPPLAAGDRLAVDSVVKVARIFAVDRHQRHVAQIDAAFAITGADRVRQFAGDGQGDFGEDMRHGKFSHRNFYFHSWIVDRAQHFDHAADRLHVALRLLHDLHHDHLTVFRAERRARRHQHVVRHALVFRHHDRDAALVEQAADQAIGPVLDHLDDFAFGPAAPVLPRLAREHAIAMQNLAHFMFGQHQVLAAVIADQEAVAFAMTLHLARQQVGARGDQQEAGAIAHDAASQFQLGDVLFELSALRAANSDLESLTEFGGRQGRTRRSERSDDCFATVIT